MPVHKGRPVLLARPRWGWGIHSSSTTPDLDRSFEGSPRVKMTSQCSWCLSTAVGGWGFPESQTPFAPTPLPAKSATGLWQSVQLHGALHRHISAQVGELHLNQLPWV